MVQGKRLEKLFIINLKCMGNNCLGNPCSVLFRLEGFNVTPFETRKMVTEIEYERFENQPRPKHLTRYAMRPCQ